MSKNNKFKSKRFEIWKNSSQKFIKQFDDNVSLAYMLIILKLNAKTNQNHLAYKGINKNTVEQRFHKRRRTMEDAKKGFKTHKNSIEKINVDFAIPKLVKKYRNLDNLQIPNLPTLKSPSKSAFSKTHRKASSLSTKNGAMQKIDSLIGDCDQFLNNNEPHDILLLHKK